MRLMGTTRKGMVWKGRCTVGRVSYLGRVNHTQVTYPTKPNRTTSQTFIIGYPIHQPYFGYPGWESDTLRYQPNSTLVTFISLSFPTLPEYPTLHTLPYLTIPKGKTIPYHTLSTVGKTPFPTSSAYSTYPIHLTLTNIPLPTLHTFIHLTLHFLHTLLGFD